MIVVACEQRSPEWFAARLGLLTASCVGDALARTKSGWSTSRRNLMLRLVLERLTNRAEASYSNAAMERGTALEPLARAAYETETGALVQEVGFIRHDTLMTGASPDGLIDADGVMELKCPGAAAHLDYLRGDWPLGYVQQVTHTLWLTGRAWADLVSYHPDFPESAQLATCRLQAVALEVDDHERAVAAFLGEVDHEMAALRQMMDRR